MSLRWLFLDLNSYFASVEQAEDPCLWNRPVAVVPMIAETTSCIAASYPAKRFGVKTGTSVRDAKLLCPDIVLIKADHRKYVRYHKRIVATVDKYLPVERILSIDEMGCELMGRERLEDVARAKAVEIKAAIARDISPALTCSIGIAPNCYLAKVASDMQKPDGLTVLHQETLLEQLAPLIPRDFPGIGSRMEQRFHQYGCLTATSLYQLSELEMRTIWGGIIGERFFHLIRGVDIPEPEHRRRSVSHSKVLAPTERTRKAAWPVAVTLLSKAAMRLRSEDLYAAELWLSLKFVERHSDQRYWAQRVRFPETNDSLLLVQELERLWQHVPHRHVLRVGVVLSSLSAVGCHQLGLFEDPRREALMTALDTVNRKYQAPTVYVAAAHASRETRLNAIAFQRIPEEYE